MKKILILITIILLANGVSAVMINPLYYPDMMDATPLGGSSDDSNINGSGDTTNKSGTGDNTNAMLSGTKGDNAISNAALGIRNPESSNPSPAAISMPELSLGGIVTWVAKILNQLIYVIIAATLVMFLYGVFKLSFVDGQKPESREQSRKFMFWGIVSLFVMVSVWGLVNILQSTFFSGGLVVPQFK